MAIVYYKIPLRLGDVLKGEELPGCDQVQSITKNLR